jgi:hypothetical protein
LFFIVIILFSYVIVTIWLCVIFLQSTLIVFYYWNIKINIKIQDIFRFVSINIHNITQVLSKKIKRGKEFTLVDRWKNCSELEVGFRAWRWPTMQKWGGYLQIMLWHPSQYKLEVKVEIKIMYIYCLWRLGCIYRLIDVALDQWIYHYA